MLGKGMHLPDSFLFLRDIDSAMCALRLPSFKSLFFRETVLIDNLAIIDYMGSR